VHEATSWQRVYAFWFPPGLEEAGPDTHRRMFLRWFGGGTTPEMPPFAPLVEAARAGRLDHWLATPRGRLSLVILLDQFPRGLFAGTPETYALDPVALRLAEEGLRNGQYEALAWPWEKTFLLLPLGHAEGPDHRQRLERAAALADRIALEVPPPLQPLYRHSASQARGHLEVIARFGRFPHRNAILGRASTPEEAAYLARGEFVHQRQPPG
jgi:uncharacterized protein (DUF924 family)